MNDEKILSQKLNWQDYHNNIDCLSDKIKKSSKFSKYKYIAAFESDDMILAVHLSHTLGIRFISDISLMTMLLNCSEVERESILIVSNVVKSGKKFNDIMNIIKGKSDTAVMYKDMSSTYNVTFYFEKPLNYILFPWQ